jgi:hypothetical protein
MIYLRNALAPLRSLVGDTIVSLMEPGAPEVSCIALHACPWAGWVIVSVDTPENSDRHVQSWLTREPDWIGRDNHGKFNASCADFAFPQWAIADFPDWRREYQDAEPAKVEQPNGEVITIPGDRGDDAFNEPFFRLLVAILEHAEEENDLRGVKAPSVLRFGVRRLDSEFSQFWTAGDQES